MEGFVLLVQPYYLQIFSSALSESQNWHGVETNEKENNNFSDDDSFRAYFDSVAEKIASVDPDW